MTPRVIVVGAGLMGLSCAVRLARAGYDTNVLARDLPAESGSANTPGLWWPVEEHSQAAWARHTFAQLQELAQDPDSGVRMLAGVLAHSGRRPRKPAWSNAFADQISPSEVFEPFPGRHSGFGFTVPVLDMPAYLARLVRELDYAGGTLTRLTVQQIPERGIVVNATGAASRMLARDNTVNAVRRQVATLTNPGLTSWVFSADGDPRFPLSIVPHGDVVTVGAHDTEGDWGTTVDTAIAEEILDRAIAIEPRLKDAEVIAHRVHLLARRSRPRVMSQDKNELKVVHCYGFGDLGVSTHLGVADAVAAHVDALVRQSRKKSSAATLF